MSQIVQHWCIRDFSFVHQRTMIQFEAAFSGSSFCNEWLPYRYPTFFAYRFHEAAAHIGCFVGIMGQCFVLAAFFLPSLEKLKLFWLESSYVACTYLQQISLLTVTEIFFVLSLRLLLSCKECKHKWLLNLKYRKSTSMAILERLHLHYNL